MNAPLAAVGLLPLVTSVILGISMATTVLDATTRDVFCEMDAVRRESIERIEAGKPLELDAGERPCPMEPADLSPPAPLPSDH